MSILTKITKGSFHSAKTRIMPPRVNDTRFSSAQTRLMTTAPCVLVYEENILVLFDVSGSMRATDVLYFRSEGVAQIIATLRRSQRENGIRYNLCIIAFSTDCEIVLPFTPIDDLPDNVSLGSLAPSGVTCTEKALQAAFDEIDAIKRRQDASPSTPRLGSILVTITDGRPTDENGREKALSREMAAEISRRAQTRKTSTVAFGFGDVNPATLKELAPSTLITYESGKVVESPHAVVCPEATGKSAEQFEILVKLVAQASSSFGHLNEANCFEPVFVEEGASGLDRLGCEVVELPAGYTVVS